MIRGPGLPYVVPAALVSATALVVLDGPPRVPSSAECADLWNMPANAEMHGDVTRFERARVGGWDTKAGPHCSVLAWTHPSGPWQTYVIWLADPDGPHAAFHTDLGGSRYGDHWFFDHAGMEAPNAVVSARGRLHVISDG